MASGPSHSQRAYCLRYLRVNLTEHIPPFLLCEIFPFKKKKKFIPSRYHVVPLTRALTVVLFDTTQTVRRQAETDSTTLLFFSAASSDTQSGSKWLQTDLDKNAKERDTREHSRKVRTIIYLSIIYRWIRYLSWIRKCFCRLSFQMFVKPRMIPERCSTKDILHGEDADHIHLLRRKKFTCCSVKPWDLILQLRKHHANTLKRQFHISIDDLLPFSLINALLKTSWNATNLE